MMFEDADLKDQNSKEVDYIEEQDNEGEGENDNSS